MKIKPAQLTPVCIVLKTLIEEERPLPTKGKYRIIRLFPVLARAVDRFHAEHNALIQRLGVQAFQKDDKGADLLDAAGNKVPGGFEIKPDSPGWPEFQTESVKLQEAEVEVSAQAIPLSQLDSPGAVQMEVTLPDGTREKRQVQPISATELLALGDFVVDDLAA